MPSRERIRLKGLEDIKRALKRFGARAERAAGKGLYAEGELIMGESKPLVPVDTGALRSTGHVQPPRREGRGVTVTMGYGGPAGTEGVTAEGRGRYVGYAWKVHEDLAAHHTTGQAKYLEVPALRAAPTSHLRVGAIMLADLQGAG